MLDSYCYPRSETCDTTVTIPFGFDAFDSNNPATLTDDIIQAFKDSKNLYLSDAHILDNALEDAFFYFMSKSEASAKHLIFIGNGNSQPHDGWLENIEKQAANLRSIGVKIWPVTPMHCDADNSEAELCPDKRVQAILRQPGFNTSMYINGHDDLEAINSEFKDMLMDGMECDPVETSKPCKDCNCKCPFVTAKNQTSRPIVLQIFPFFCDFLLLQLSKSAHQTATNPVHLAFLATKEFKPPARAVAPEHQVNRALTAFPERLAVTVIQVSRASAFSLSRANPSHQRSI